MSFSRSVLGFTAVTSPRPLLASSSSPWTCPNRPVGTLSPAHHRAAKLRSPNAFPICCNASAVGKEDPDGDVLDEKAMRAAEIHEVLDGLQEFRQRIIDGRGGSSPFLFCTPPDLLSRMLTLRVHFPPYLCRFDLLCAFVADATKLAKKVRGKEPLVFLVSGQPSRGATVDLCCSDLTF